MVKSRRQSASLIAIVAAVLLLLVAARTLDSLLNPIAPSPDITNVATMIIKDKNPALYPADYLFYNRDLYAAYIPVYRWVLDQLWQISGSFENALLWLVPILTTVYLAGVFLLLWYVTRNIWISLGLTVANATIYPTLGDTHWGMSNTTTMGARSFFMAVTPYLALLYFQLLQAPRWYKGLAFGLLIGIFSAFHPISGFHFLVVMLAWSIFVMEKTGRGWQTILAIVPGVILTGWPVARNMLTIVNKPASGGVSFEMFSQVVRERREMPFFPATLDWTLLNLRLDQPILEALIWFYVATVLCFVVACFYSIRRRPNLLKWVWLVAGLVTVFYAYMAAQFNTPFMFAVVAIYLLIRCWRGQLAQLDKGLVILMGLVILYSFVGYYVVTFLWQELELWSFTAVQLEFNRSARFIYLPTYLLVGLAGVALVNGLKGHPLFANYGTETTYSMMVGLVYALAGSASQPFANSLLLTGLVIGSLTCLVVALVFVSERLLPEVILPYLVLFLFFLVLFGPAADIVADYTPVPANNIFLAETWNLQPVYTETETELYNWVLANTSQAALFWVCDVDSAQQTRFRFKAQRSISHNWKDLPFHIRYRATLIPAYERYNMLEEACEKSYNDIAATATNIKADYLLITPGLATYYLSQACFSNEEYAVFTLDPNGCPQH